MRLLFLSKRHPQQRDLIERPFGRFYYLPTLLAAMGHTVRVETISHRGLPELQTIINGVSWSSRDVKPPRPIKLYRSLLKDTLDFQPDWIIGCSDAWYGCLAQWLAHVTKARLAIDAYDNYEAYMPWNIPLHRMWRRSVNKADLVTAAGPGLAFRLQSYRQSGRAVEILPMAADPQFAPANKEQSRASLGLPQDVPLLGYVGSWSANRGSSLLIDALDAVRSIRPDVRLITSGKPPAYVTEAAGVTQCGYVEDSALPSLISALDVACVVTANTEFGRYSYPAKLCEAMACQVPVVATATEPVRWMLHGDEAHLAEPGDAESFSRKIMGLLDLPRSTYSYSHSWSTVAAEFSALLQAEDERA